MGATHFLTRTIKRVSTEMSLHVLAYNLKRVIAIVGVETLASGRHTALKGRMRRIKGVIGACPPLRGPAAKNSTRQTADL